MWYGKWFDKWHDTWRETNGGLRGLPSPWWMSRPPPGWARVAVCLAVLIWVGQLSMPRLASAATPAPMAPSETTSSLTQRLERLLDNAAAPMEPAGCLAPLLAEATLDWNDLSLELQTELTPLMTRPTDGSETMGGIDVSYEAYGASTIISRVASPFRIWYVTDSEAAVDSTDTDPADGIPDYVQRVEETLQQVYSQTTSSLGYQPPVGDGSIGGGVDQYDVYLTELSAAGVFGYVAADGCSGSPLTCVTYMVLDNNYTDEIYSTQGLEALQVTAAHEFFHGVQFSYELENNSWWMENTATWIEDVLYDDVNDYVHYLPAFAEAPDLPLTTANGAWEYGNVIWPRYLSEAFGDELIRLIWERIGQEAGDNTLRAFEEVLALQDYGLEEVLLEHRSFNQNKARYEEGTLYWGELDAIVPSAIISTYPSTVRADGMDAGAMAALSTRFIRLEPRPADEHGTLSLSVDVGDPPLDLALVVETRCGTAYEQALPVDEGGVGAVKLADLGGSIAAVTLVVSNPCWEGGDCDGRTFSLDAGMEDGEAIIDEDGDCVAPLQAGGGDCDDGDPARGPFAEEIADGLDNDCDGSLDEGPGVPMLLPTPLSFFQGQDYNLRYQTRGLALESANGYPGVAFSILEEVVHDGHRATIGGMIGLEAPAEAALIVENDQGMVEGVIYVASIPRTSLSTLRPESGTLSTEAGLAHFEVDNPLEQTLLATVTSTGASPFTPALRWIASDGITELARGSTALGVEAPAGVLYLRISDEAGGAGATYQLSVVLSEGCAQDNDGDGYISEACPGGTDCNDSSVAISPAAEEIPYDGVDQDCSGADLTDQDGDGFDAEAAGDTGGGPYDCDDQDSSTYPGAAEVCDTADNDCDGVPNDGLEGCDLEVCDGLDNDGDGQVDEGFDGDGIGGPDCSDADGDGYSEDGGDCDDEAAAISPAGSDIPYDGVDQDCSGADLTDLDGDGYDGISAEEGGSDPVDCDDTNSSIHPNAVEQCDFKDNDCDGAVDEDTDADGIGGLDCYDDDGDGYTELEGDCQDEDETISPVAEEVPYDGVDQDCTGADLVDVDGDGFDGGPDGVDCEDGSVAAYPGGLEVCDGLDNDCNGETDEGFDADGLGGADCLDDDGDGFSEDAGDCDDGQPSVGLGFEEVCDGLDNDCDGGTDEGFDADGLGGADCLDDDADTYSEDQGDCDDGRSEINPEALEICDDRDNNCDGVVDEGFDADGIGGADCTDDDFDGYSEDEGDCKDTDRAYYPGATDTPYNGQDEDCDGADLTDVDGDGYDSVLADGDDCDDDSPRVYPGAQEIALNGVDEDCDGYDFEDADLDGYSAASAGGEDCNDLDAGTYPGAEEIPYNGADEDCNGSDLVDVDGDKFDAAEVGGSDCDDSDPEAHPYGEEIPYDGVDQDCEDGDLVDVDGDLYASTVVGGDDCDDSDPAISPVVEEVCGDGVDNNCDGLVDEYCDDGIGCNCTVGAAPDRAPASSPWALFLGVVALGVIWRGRY